MVLRMGVLMDELAAVSSETHRSERNNNFIEAVSYSCSIVPRI